MKFTKIITIFCFLFYSCRTQNCNVLPNEFKNFEEAKVLIQKANFSFTEELNTEKSSWIKIGKYFSCDSKVGFFLFKTDKETYIHQNIPIEIWNEFKQASSIGSYYNRNIKHNYQLIIKK